MVRRTLSGPLLCARFGPSAATIGFFTTLLWALHPLQTESVTCVAQRTESLCGLFYLLTLYALSRGAACHPLDDKRQTRPARTPDSCHPLNDKSSHRRRAPVWLGLSVVWGLAGMGAKEGLLTRYADQVVEPLDDHSAQRHDLDQISRTAHDRRDRRWRGFNFFLTEDLSVILALLRGEFALHGLSGRRLRRLLPRKTPGQIGRILKRLRLHGLKISPVRDE